VVPGLSVFCFLCLWPVGSSPPSSVMAAENDTLHVRDREEWTGDVWKHDEWSEEEKAKARSRLHASRTKESKYEQFRTDSCTNWNSFYHNK